MRNNGCCLANIVNTRNLDSNHYGGHWAIVGYRTFSDEGCLISPLIFNRVKRINNEGGHEQGLENLEPPFSDKRTFLIDM